MRSGVVFFIGALLLLAESCATHKAVIGSKSISADQVHDVVLANQSRMHTAMGEGTISVETPALAQSGSFRLTLKKPDSLLVNLQGPFGIKIGSALLTRTNFLFYNSLENRLYSGETTSRNLLRILRVNIGFDDLMNLFTGGVFLKEDVGQPNATGVEDDQFTLLYRNGSETHKYYIDPLTLLITRTEALDDQGKLEFEQRFLNFQTVDSALVPFNIRLIQPKERRMISVVYSNLTLNAQDAAFKFSYPQNAKRVTWQ
jgi:outer membrane lipoprotein-sorting protein